MAGKAGRRSFGHLRRLPSKRWQASYIGPDLVRHGAPSTFDTREDAEAWLADRRRDITGEEWQPPTRRQPLRFGDYAEAWLGQRTLKPRTRAHYRALLDRHILPTFGPLALKAITAEQVRRWHSTTATGTPTLRAHVYALVRSVLGAAVQDQLIPVNPAHIRGAGTSKRVHQIQPLSLAELETLVAAMPPRYRLMTLLAAWCGLRFGELTELRRGDIDAKSGAIRVRRGVVHIGSATIVSTPKSDAGVRDVAIPPHLMAAVREHLSASISGGKDGLLFPAPDGTSHLAPSTLYWVFHQAREAAGRPNLRFHDLRHTGAVLAAATGASLAELMARLGHSTPSMALRYQHVAAGRDHAIAAGLSKMAETP